MSTELQIDFKVHATDAEAFERMYRNSYVAALKRQRGYLGSRLLRAYSSEVVERIGAQATPFNYQMCLRFQTEDDRVAWANSLDHEEAWAGALGLSQDARHRGYDLVAHDV